jgi:hypothetical protein
MWKGKWRGVSTGPTLKLVMGARCSSGTLLQTVQLGEFVKRERVEKEAETKK